MEYFKIGTLSEEDFDLMIGKSGGKKYP